MPGPRDSLALKRILCATDFSDSAAAALEFAVSLARPCQAEIRIVHVCPARVPSGRPMTWRAHPGLEAKSQIDLIRDLDRLGQPALAAGVSTRSVVRQGDASEEIVSEAKHTPADLIVMGRHSQGAPNPWVLGSVAERVLRQAPCPVVVVRPSLRHGREGSRHVLCALDLGDTAAATLGYAALLADAIDADLIVLHVVADGRAQVPRRTMAAVLSSAPATKGVIREQVVTGVPYQEILAAVHENGACLVVVGSHGGGIADHQFLGSTTLHLLRQSECPVLVVPAGLSPPSQETSERDVSPACGHRP